jgi:hypothetical protein
LEVNVAQLEVMVRFVEMMNLGLEFFDASAFLGAGEFEAASGGSRGAINKNEITNCRETGTDNDKESPEPFTLANGMNEHPGLKYKDNNQPWVAERHSKEIKQQPMEHIGEARQRNDGWQQSLESQHPRLTNLPPAKIFTCFRAKARLIICGLLMHE